MDESINLADALRLIKNSNTKDRSARLEDLKYILDHNSELGEKTVSNDAYHKIFEVLFQINLSDQSMYYNASSKSPAAKRLAEGAQTLRYVLKSGLTTIRTTTLKALLDHLTKTIQISGKGLCEPICLDYARCLRLILSYAPHVEHLQQDTWNNVMSACVDLLNIKASWDLPGTKLAESVADELWTCIQKLTSTPNAPITKTASEILQTVFQHSSDVKLIVTTARSMAATINNILHCIVIEDIRLVRASLLPILRLVRQLWHMKSNPLKEELLSCLIRLSPFLTNELRSRHDVVSECRSVYEVIHGHYNSRMEKKQLRIEDVRLLSTNHWGGQISRSRSNNGVIQLIKPAANLEWSIISSLADLAYVHDRHYSATQPADADYSGISEERPSKRLRRTIEPERLLYSTSHELSTITITTLQITSLLKDDYFSTPSHLQTTLASILPGCASTDHAFAAWSYTAVASLAWQRVATHPTLSDTWGNIWQTAVRSISRAATCRTACHTLNVLYARDLGSPSSLASFLEEHSPLPEEREPAILCDSSLQFMHTLASKVSSAAKTADQSLASHMLLWLLKRWSTVTTSIAQRNAVVDDVPELDLVRLLAAILVQDCPDITASAEAHESPTADAIIQTNSTKELHNYLLQRSKTPDDQKSDNGTGGLGRESASKISQKSNHCKQAEDMLLKHIGGYLPQLLLDYDEIFIQRPRALGNLEFASTVSTIAVLILILHDFSFDDGEIVKQLHSQCEKLLSTIQQFASSSLCSNEKLESLYRISWSIMCSSESDTGFTLRRQSQAAKCIASCIDAIAKAREQDDYTIDNNKSIGTNTYTSIGSSQGVSDANGRSESFPVSLADTRLSSYTWRIKVSQCASRICSPPPSSGDESMVLSSFGGPNGFDTMNDEAFTMLLANLVADQETMTLEPREVEQILDAASSRVFVSYKFNRSEPVLAACVDFMTTTCHVWTDVTNRSLQDLGLDMYEWLINVALSVRVVSPVIEQKMAALLLELCRLDPSFGSQSADPSARTHLFRLLNSGPIQVQFYLSSRMPVIFGLFTESAHGKMFDDLQESLPREVTWLEGIAMRLLVLAELATAWRSLLRQCVYYIFETAGRIPDSREFAACCMRKISSSLSMTSSTELFNVFGQQMLYTWLEGHQLQRVPYTLFDYSTRQAFLIANQIEIIAQLFVKGDDASLAYVADTLQSTINDLLRQRSTFANVLAYCMSRDITHSANDGKAGKVEDRLREMVGGKEEMKRLIKETYPTIIGHLFRSASVDSRDDKWLEKREAYTQPASVLLAMRKHGSSTLQLPASQQPHYKVKYLADLLERLSRRLSQTSVEKLWNESSYTVAAHMILDELSPASDQLHHCVVLEKLRFLIALAGPTVNEHYSFECTVRAVVPFISQHSTIGDAVGILRHVIVSGFDYAGEKWSFTLGVAILMLLRILKLQKDLQTGKSSQSQASQVINQAHSFKTWLLPTLERLSTHVIRSELRTEAQEVLQYLEPLDLPGNSNHDSAESNLLLFLLRCTSGKSKFMESNDALKAIHLLTDDFESNNDRDCLEDDRLAIQYAGSMWNVARSSSLDAQFRLWAISVVSRAYAASGDRDIFTTDRSFTHGSDKSKAAGSEEQIAKAIEVRLSFDQQQEVNLAAYTLRSMLEHEKNSKRKMAIRRGLAVSCYFDEGTFGYMPSSVVDQHDLTTSDLHTLLSTSQHDSLDTWTKNLAIHMCRHSFTKQHTMFEGLVAMLQQVPGFAKIVMPQIIHVMLRDELDASHSLQNDLAACFDSHFADESAELRSRQQYLLENLVFLNTQPYPGEKSLLDRLQWIPCNLMIASACAVRCEMPATALQLAELANSPKTINRRTSRTPLDESNGRSISNELLLSIFTSIDEPDSYYGVEQTASLDSFMQRSEYEGNGFQALYLRTGHLNSLLADRHRLQSSDSSNILPALSRLNLHGLTLMLAQSFSRSAPISSSATIDAARLLQQWDIVTMGKGQTAASLLYQAMFSVVTQADPNSLQHSISGIIQQHVEPYLQTSKPSSEWLSTLVALTDINNIVTTNPGQLPDLSNDRYRWMELASFDSFKQIVLNRPIVYAAIADNADLLRQSNKSRKDLLVDQAKALAVVAKLTRLHKELEASASSAFSLDQLSQKAQQDGLHIDSMVRCETSEVLWQAGEQAASIKILQDVAKTHAKTTQDIPIGLSGLLAQIGKHSSEARLEKPADIVRKYLRTAITTLESKTGREAGQVYFTFAKFCDNQLQSSAAQEDFRRISMLRQSKLNEVQQLRAFIESSKKSGDERRRQERMLNKATTWFKIDDEEYQRLKDSQDEYIQQSLTNYMLALKASDDHNSCVLRLFALWLENHDTVTAQSAIDAQVSDVPSWKFVLLMNQLLSRLKGDQTDFQKSLLSLIQRICQDHTYHTVHHIYASRKTPAKDSAAHLRRTTAENLTKDLARKSPNGNLFGKMLRADSLYKQLAEETNDDWRPGSKVTIRDSEATKKISKHVPAEQIPPATIDLPLQPDGRYKDVPVITGLAPTISIMSGLSAPKVLTVICSNGQQYKQLFKGGNDDLRQDAIMEQVFGEVSKMLVNHKATRQRNLHVRTYKVIPLTPRAGIIEFVPNSIPINDFLQPAHSKYYPASLKASVARQKIAGVADHSTETRVKEFRRVCEQMPPVMRFFFFERFQDPDEWFEKRTAYTRSTATISMLGQVLGLGDRHCHNILLDEHSGEVVHIDLGVAFETGRILPIPELVPFRLTRDIVDGMGVTGVEGVFKRCCEFTLEALREDKDGIMTLLNVLRYDPLYNWTLSPLQARRIQQEDGTDQAIHVKGAVEGGKKTENEASEAQRALAVVEKKLGKSLNASAAVSELIQQARDDRNLATLFNGWAAFY